MPKGLLIRASVVLAAVSMLGTGSWARLDPESFARFANWPNHVHFLHDAGVFQIGIGMMTMCALIWRDAQAVVLAGFAVTSGLHALNHAVDLDLGGNASDPWILLAMTALGLAAATARIRHLHRRTDGRTEVTP